MNRRHWKRVAATVGALSVVGTLSMVTLISLGEVTIVSTSGVSMQPLLHQGDLVVVRSSDYGVGDVVAYPSSSGQTVLHRVTERSGDLLTLRGDNNDWTDPDRPRTTDVIGELWFHLPGGGKAIDWLRGPLPASAVLAALGMMVTRSAPDARGDRRWRFGRLTSWIGIRSGRPGVSRDPRDRGPRGERVPGGPRGSRAASGLHARTVLGGAVFVLVVATGIGAMAYARPTTELTDERTTFEHHGSLTYSAPAPAGPVYEDGQITTGDPIFLDLADQVRLQFAYRLDADDLREVTGQAELAVELTSGNGWSRTVTLGEPVGFTGTDASVEATLDLSELHGLIDDVEQATGVRGSTYAIAIVPTVSVSATADDEAVTETFDERHEFQLDDKQLRPTGSGADSATGDAPLRTDRAGAVTSTIRTPTTVSALGRSVVVSTVRTVTTVAAAAALLAALAAGTFLAVRGPRTEADRIAARYGRRIVAVDGGEGGEARTIIDVSTITALVRLADHHDRLILHHRSDAGDTFMVDAHDTLYRHRVGPAPVELGAPAR